MQPPDELMVQRFLPALRLLVARALLEQGQSQAKVSRALGVTQASVSHYSVSSPDRAYASLESLSVSREDADRFVALLGEDLRRDPSYAVETLTNIWTGLLGRGAVCPAHRALYPSLAGCDVCMRQFGKESEGRYEAITGVADAVRLLESSPSFASVMPEVSVNVAYLAGDSDSPEDVVAVPGRIVRVKNSARAMQPPAFGASRHLAGVLLLVRKRRQGVRAVINLRYDARMVSVLSQLGLRVLEIGAYSAGGEGDPTVEALRRRLVSFKAAFDAVADPGSRGIEPSLYLLGKSAVDAARLAIRVSALYSAS
ncbi:MAG TPA: thiamine-phosphate synthase family protein [Nitrososphaerales archaeon]|nr:thiamine-phosphate synthase family protein [Nitrososphaerales archaeon]